MTPQEKKRAQDRAYYERNSTAIKARVNAYRIANADAVKERKRAYYQRRRDHVLARVRRYAEENREMVLAKRKEGYRRGRERERAQQRLYRQTHLEFVRAINRAWSEIDRARHPEKYAAYQQVRRARKLAAFVEFVTVTELLRRDRRRCGLCQRIVAKKDASIDHIIPLSRGGEHSYRNTQLAHLECNRQKGARSRGQLRLLG